MTCINILNVFLMLCLSVNFISGFKWEIEMIKDFLRTEDSKSFTVNIYNCWGKEQKYKFSKTLFKENVFASNAEEVKNYYPYYKSKFVVDLDCSNFRNILLKANEEKMFSNTNSWLLISRKPNSIKALKNSFLQYDFFVDSNVILAERKNDNESEAEYFFKEIYKISAKSTEVIEHLIGRWNYRTGLVYLNNYKALFADRRRDLQNILLEAKIVVLNNDTLNHLQDYRDKHIDSITKVTYIFTKHLIEYVNAKLIIHAVDSWGYLDETTNLYTGMIGSMQRNESEIGGGTTFIFEANLELTKYQSFKSYGAVHNKNRLPLIDYIAITAPIKIRFVFRQPQLNYEQNIFTLPFTSSLWISVFALIVLAILLLSSAFWWENKHPNHSDSEYVRASLLDIVMLTLGAVAQQGTSTEPRNASGKMIMLFTFIAFMFLYVSYSANIVALLQLSTNNIRTLENLLKSGLTLGAEDTIYNRYYMSTVSDTTRKKIYDTKMCPPDQPCHFIPIEEGVKRIREGFYAFHMDLGRGYKHVEDTFLENEKCGLQEIQFMFVDGAYFSIKKNSTFKEIFNLGLRKLRESGIQARVLSKIYTRKPECHSGGGMFLSVGLMDVYPAFLFLAAGIAISFTLFIFEIFVQKLSLLCR